MSRAPFHSEMISDPKVWEILVELSVHDVRAFAERRSRAEQSPSGTRESRGSRRRLGDPFEAAEVGFSISPQLGDQLYLLARHSGARTVAEFATSRGFSTLFLAAAVRDNGGGTVHTAELVPEKSQAAQEHIRRAGLEDYVDFRVGDARDVHRELPDGVDLALIDGWDPDVSLQVLKVIEPKLRSGAVVVNDNQEEDYLAYVRNPSNGYRSMSLLSGSEQKKRCEISLRI
ncbi:O-methyltransferase [Brevibacterium aurantiacum]|uniref:Methyltransferase n=1 Tax=Brevibacterium aurantiacum TaxID=273384 RepID=A0A556CAQ6_BREAU|nr:class I SAM-dependent methyltransferase [Brevibacterium aurantiacum]TSI14513.1 hypothetical protein FO013_14150 [Brevibacterium aurantiacum]